jgi:hypothetical protein
VLDIADGHLADHSDDKVLLTGDLQRFLRKSSLPLIPDDVSERWSCPPRVWRADSAAWHHGEGNGMSAHFSGDVSVVSNVVDDGVGAVSFNIDVNFNDASGSQHDGEVRCDSPVRIVSEQLTDGAGHFSSQTNGNIYQWETRCPPTQGVHYIIELAYVTSLVPGNQYYTWRKALSDVLPAVAGIAAGAVFAVLLRSLIRGLQS